MATRRHFFSLAGPLAAAPRPLGYQGAFLPGRLAARYFPRERQTWILFETNSTLRAGYFDHDSARWSQPQPAFGKEPFPALPAPTGPEVTLNEKNPGLRLLARDGQLMLWERRSPASPWQERRTLFTYSGGPPLLVLPDPSHPDLIALWSHNGRLYSTNRDLLRVYVLPAQLRDPLEPATRLP